MRVEAGFYWAKDIAAGRLRVVEVRGKPGRLELYVTGTDEPYILDGVEFEIVERIEPPPALLDPFYEERVAAEKLERLEGARRTYARVFYGSDRVGADKPLGEHETRALDAALAVAGAPCAPALDDGWRRGTYDGRGRFHLWNTKTEATDTIPQPEHEVWEMRCAAHRPRPPEEHRDGKLRYGTRNVKALTAHLAREASEGRLSVVCALSLAEDGTVAVQSAAEKGDPSPFELLGLVSYAHHMLAQGFTDPVRKKGRRS
jgi:hypothetical protein